ncbi:MAG TPA: DUF1343 domain-containing protein [Verrucomicrobiota bacterium]|jgi:uncharacterized protein YbbC (DUF1343 family)|nr:DUF1343 domain-containing protein [Verrucomicrobiota bacterium]
MRFATHWVGFVLLVACFATAQARVFLGNEVLAMRGFESLRGKRIGLLTNPSGVDSRGRSIIDILHRSPKVNLVALFGAEHGVDGQVSAGKEFPNSTHRRTGLPIYSLYGPGPVRKPTMAMLQKIDCLVYDIQDTGARSYTFISTMGLCMEQCGKAGIEFVVLDRPNPLGGNRVEGLILNPRFKSLVGQWKIPYVYGMTAGELAYMISGEGWISHRPKISIIKMKNWTRSMTWRGTGLKWIPTSPNIPHGDSALHYVSTGVLGELGAGSGLTIGIGEGMPFECVASTWLDSNAAARHLNARRLPGVRFEPLRFKSRRVKNRTYSGVRIKFTNRAVAPLMAINYHIVDAVKAVAKRDLFATRVKSGRSFNMFDKVNGTDSIRRDLAAGRSGAAIVRSWSKDEASFGQQRAKYLLYK